MAIPTGTEILTVQGVQANGQLAATTETFTLSQVTSLPDNFGNGTGIFGTEGNLIAAPFVPATTPAGITNDYVMAIYSIPANSFSASGKGISAAAYGSFAANTDTKVVKIIFNPTSAVVGSIVSGGTTIASTGSVTNSNVGFSISGQVYKYGATGSNTQIVNQTSGNNGSVDSGVTIPATITANESGNILVAVTGNPSTITTDILLSIFRVVGQN